MTGRLQHVTIPGFECQPLWIWEWWSSRSISTFHWAQYLTFPHRKRMGCDSPGAPLRWPGWNSNWAAEQPKTHLKRPRTPTDAPFVPRCLPMFGRINTCRKPSWSEAKRSSLRRWRFYNCKWEQRNVRIKRRYTSDCCFRNRYYNVSVSSCIGFPGVDRTCKQNRQFTILLSMSWFKCAEV